jgi:hypothetical protein
MTCIAASQRKHSADNSPWQADDELDAPYLAGFEWDKDESWTRLVVHLTKNPGPSGGGGGGGGGKKKKNKGEDA